MNNTKLFFLYTLLLTGVFVQAQSKAKRPPNIVFILADDLGYGDLSCYGQQKFSTPNIDRLAAEGMKFSQAYAGTAVCAPSRSALFTGLHTGHTPIRGNLGVKPEGQYPLPDSTVILPQLLKKAGYATGLFGKWGLGYPGSTGDPTNKGIDEFFGFNCQTLAHNYYPYYLWHNREKVLLPENSGAQSGTYAPELIQQKTLAFIEQHKNLPFAVFVTTTIPHAEVAAPDAYMQQTIGRYNPEKPFVGPDTTLPTYTKAGKYNSQRYPHAGYAAMVLLLDQHVGEIARKLKELHLEDNTLVIFTSDNGPSIEGGEDPLYFNSSGGLRGHKRDLYEGGIREPFLAKWPGHIPQGAESQLPIAFWDMLPTITEIAGIKNPLPTDGVSIVPTLTGKGTQRLHPYLYWEFYEEGGRVAARMGRWKAIRQNMAESQNGPIELYNLEADPGEQNDVSAMHPDLVAQFSAIFKKEHTPSPVFHFLPKKKTVDE